MKRKFWFRIVLLGMVLITLHSSCYTIQPVEFKKAENITLARTETDFEVTFDLAMYNPNNYSLRLKDVFTEVTIDNKPLGKANLVSTVRLKRNNDFLLPIKAKASVGDLMNLSSLGINLLLGKQSATATIKGNMTLKKFIFRKKVPFEYREKIDSKVLQSLF